MSDPMNFEILEHINVAVVAIEPFDFQIVYANNQMVELSAHPREELITKKITDFFENEEKLRFNDFILLKPNTHQTTLSDPNFQFLRKSRRKVPVSLGISQLEDNSLFLVTVQDNTLVKNAEWQLANAQSRLVESAKFKALGEMAGGIAHEINNPLAIISGLSQSLVNFSDNQEITEISKRIDNTVHRMSKIISGLKNISRDHSDDQYAKVSLAAVVDDTLEFCKERFRNSEIQMHTHSPDPDWLINGQQTQLSQILLNLLNNAYDAVQGLPKKWIEVSHERTPTHYIISVTDSGSGIAPKIQQKIMQPFFTTKEVGQGTGLGLSISRSIMEAHGGSLTLNKNFKNTQFLLKFPIPEENAVAPPLQPANSEANLALTPSPENSFNNFQPTVLIVDDEKDITEIVKVQLKKRGFKTLVASCGQEAVKIIESEYIDAVLSDIRMPNGDGYWLLKRLSRLSYNIPLIFCTGSVNISLEEAYSLGASAVFFKPIKFAALIDAILLVVTPKEQKWSRRVLRVDTDLAVKVQFQGSNQLSENMINLGKGGMFVSKKSNFPQLGETIHFEFISSSYPEQPIRGSGIVRWVRKNDIPGIPSGYGIEFVYVDDPSMQPLIELINGICTHSYIPNS